MTVRADGNIEIHTGITIEDNQSRIKVDIDNGTIITTIDADGQKVTGSTDQIMVDSTLDANQESAIQRDPIIEKL